MQPEIYFLESPKKKSTFGGAEVSEFNRNSFDSDRVLSVRFTIDVAIDLRQNSEETKNSLQLMLSS